jgi:hypothetical protein
LPTDALPTDALPNEPISPLQPQPEPATDSDSGTNPLPPENAPSATVAATTAPEPDLRPSIGVPRHPPAAGAPAVASCRHALAHRKSGISPQPGARECVRRTANRRRRSLSPRAPSEGAPGAPLCPFAVQ